MNFRISNNIIYWYVTSASYGGQYWKDVEQGFNESIKIFNCNERISESKFIYAGNVDGDKNKQAFSTECRFSEDFFLDEKF